MLPPPTIVRSISSLLFSFLPHSEVYLYRSIVCLFLSNMGTTKTEFSHQHFQEKILAKFRDCFQTFLFLPLTLYSLILAVFIPQFYNLTIKFSLNLFCSYLLSGEPNNLKHTILFEQHFLRIRIYIDYTLKYVEKAGVEVLCLAQENSRLKKCNCSWFLIHSNKLNLHLSHSIISLLMLFVLKQIKFSCSHYFSPNPSLLSVDIQNNVAIAIFSYCRWCSTNEFISIYYDKLSQKGNSKLSETTKSFFSEVL